MTYQAVDQTSLSGINFASKEPFEVQRLVQSLQSILSQIDDEYERERDSLIKTLPDGGVKERALAMLKTRHRQRRENYVRELSALLEGTQ